MPQGPRRGPPLKVSPPPVCMRPPVSFAHAHPFRPALPAFFPCRLLRSQPEPQLAQKLQAQRPAARC